MKERGKILPDIEGQCPEGYIFQSETGLCVKSEGCPEGQHRDENTGQCVPDLEEKPEGTTVAVGKGPPDTGSKPVELLDLDEKITYSKLFLRAMNAENELKETKARLEISEGEHQKQVDRLKRDYDRKIEVVLEDNKGLEEKVDQLTGDLAEKEEFERKSWNEKQAVYEDKISELLKEMEQVKGANKKEPLRTKRQVLHRE